MAIILYYHTTYLAVKHDIRYFAHIAWTRPIVRPHLYGAGEKECYSCVSTLNKQTVTEQACNERNAGTSTMRTCMDRIIVR